MCSSKKQEPDPNGAAGLKIRIPYYFKGRLLGEGGFAKCYKFTCSENNKTFAGKVLAKSSLVKSKAKEKLNSEIEIHKSLHHPHIVAYEYHFEDTENVYLLLELCQNQTLKELLQRRKTLTELEVQCYIVQLIKAMKYLRLNRIIHRDLKLSNLFLTDKMELKVGDFGLATKLDFEGERKRTVCGTPNYVAPEILNRKTGYSYEVDIWSLGVIIYTLIIGKTPFESRDLKTTYNRIKMNSYTFPRNAIISEAAKNLISQILVLDPGTRPTLDQILTHDFFNQGTSIPKLLPTSTLACPPSLSYIKQFMPEVGEDGIVNKPVTSTKLIDKPTGNNNIGSNENKNENIAKNVNTSQADQNIKGPDIWVKKWVDYSSKYGMGYLLSNGFIGGIFNDNSKIILNPTTKQFYYIERRANDNQEIINSHYIDNFPKDLQNKVAILNHFKNFIEGQSNPVQLQQSNEKKGEAKDNQFTYVKKWIKTRHAIIFRLSNKFCQVCFQDKTEIILSSERSIVTYVNKKGERMTYTLVTALEMGNYEMTKRINYTKDILTHILTMNQQKNAQRSQNNNQDNNK